MSSEDQRPHLPHVNTATIRDEGFGEQTESPAQHHREPSGELQNKPREKIIRVDMIYDKNRRIQRLVKSAKPKNNSKQLGRYVFTVAKRISAQGVFTGEYHVEIRGRQLCNTLNRILGEYAGKSFDGALVALDTEELKLLYHALPQLGDEMRAVERQAPTTEDHNILLFELSAAVEFTTTHFSYEIEETAKFPQGQISFKLLWTLFKPGALLYGKDKLSEGRVYRLRSSGYGQEQDGSLFLGLIVEYIDYDGNSVGFVDKVVYKIEAFNDLSHIVRLPFFPVGHLPGWDKKRKDLIQRAEKSLSITQKSPQEYKGHALDEEGKRFNSHGRVMIDLASYQEFCGSGSLVLPVVTPIQRNQLTEEHKLLLNSVLYGFSLGDKIWGAFAVSRLSDITWDNEIFDSLVLSKKRIDFLKAMVESHRPGSNDQFDDIVRDKGKGLVGLFSGPPGVGKTLTAEAIAEVAHRPLYVLSSGELGDHSTAVQEQLDRVLELTEAWEAILLLDEADVFLVQRDNENLARNAITSVFLRKLEYYQGILLLTTNRCDSIDSAFQSRVHFCFDYQPLGVNAREQLWSTFLARISSTGQVVLKVSAKERKKLAERELNGRQIKNIMSITRAYAVERKLPITADDIRDAIDFAAWTCDDDAHPIKRVPNIWLLLGPLAAILCLLYGYFLTG